MKKTILVTGVGGDIGEGICKCLRARRTRVRTMGCDIEPNPACAQWMDVQVQAPSARQVSPYRHFIDELVKKENIRFIIPGSDPEILFFDRHRDLWPPNRVHVLINDRSILKTFMDKWSAYQFFQRHDLPTVKTWGLQETNGTLKFPLIVKPRKGAGSRGVARVDGAQQLKAWKILLPDGIVQRYLSNEKEEYTTGIFSNGTKTAAISFRRQLGYNGVSRRVEYVDEPVLRHLALQLAKACGLVGVLNMQTRKEAGRFFILEVNPRFSSTVYFRHKFGFHDVGWWIDYCSGKDFHFIPKFHQGIGVRHLEESFFNLA